MLAAYDATDEVEELRRTIADAEAKISRYRATLDVGGDPALIDGRFKIARRACASF